jgi:hypothetical protein
VVVAVVLAIGAAPFAWPHMFGHQQQSAAAGIQTTPSPNYNIYRGHRWYLQIPGSSSGYLDLESSDKIAFWNTQQQLLGTYNIESTGQLTVHWTGVSSGMVVFDQAVVDAMAPVGDTAPMFIRSTTPATLVLQIASHTLTFAEHYPEASGTQDTRI